MKQIIKEITILIKQYFHPRKFSFSIAFTVVNGAPLAIILQLEEKLIVGKKNKNLMFVPVTTFRKIGLLLPGKQSIKASVFLWINILSITFLITSAALQFFYMDKNIFQAIEILEAVAMTGQVIAKLSVLAFKKDRFVALVDLSAKFWKSYSCPKAKYKEIEGTTKNIVFVQKIFFGMAIAALALMASTMLFGKSLPAGVWLMKNQEFFHQMNVYVYVFIFPISGMGVVATDLIFLALCVEIGLQFKILCSHIEELDVGNIYSKTDMKIYKAKLILYVEYHQFLIRYMRTIASAYSPIFMIEFVTIAPLICFELYGASESMDSIMALRYMFIVMPASLQLGFYCLSSDYVINEAMIVCQAIYNSNWYGAYFKSLRFPIIMILQASQKELEFSAMGLVRMNSKTLLAVFRASMSVSAILRSLKK